MVTPRIVCVQETVKRLDSYATRVVNFLDHATERLTSPKATLLLFEPLLRLLGRRHKDCDPTHAQRVLIVRPDEIGDVLMTTPLLRELRRSLPHAWVTLVVKPAVYDLMELCPYVDEVLGYDWTSPDDFRRIRRHGRAMGLAARRLWRQGFDVAIVPRWDADDYHAAFIAYFSGAPRRIAYSEKVTDYKSRVNADYDRLYTDVLADKSVKHEVERNLALIRVFGGAIQETRLESWASPEDHAFAEWVMKAYDITPDTLLIAVGPGARAPRRRWPLSHFGTLGGHLVREYNARLLILGERVDDALGQELERGIGDALINMVGRTTLRQAGALLRRCQLYVGNDSGVMHLAAAAGVPVIEISAHPAEGLPLHANSPKRFGPWGVPHCVLQPERPRSPCSGACEATDAHCIREITVERVEEAAIQHLREILYRRNDARSARFNGVRND
jgi:ADP-heptose:LPS heptosyltransferase